jgi:hypothetical protein
MEEAAAGGQALVRINNSLVKVQEWIDDNMKTRRVGGLSNRWHRNTEGDRQGREMANRMNLKGSPLGGSSKPTGQIGGGQ